MRGEIDGAALEQRKEAAAAQARQEKGDPKLDELLAAFNELEQAKQAVRTARAKVEALLQPFEAAGSSASGGSSGSDAVC